MKRKISYYCHINSCYLGKNDIAKSAVPVGTKNSCFFFFFFFFLLLLLLLLLLLFVLNLCLVAVANVMPSQTFDISLIVVTPTIDSICSYFVLLVANWLFLYFFQNRSLHAATDLIRV